MSTAAGISDYLTSPASGRATTRPTQPTTGSAAAKTPKLGKKYVSKGQDRIVMDGKVKAVVTRFTEEGGVILQVSNHRHAQHHKIYLEQGFPEH
jgi:hypothetical protein